MGKEQGTQEINSDYKINKDASSNKCTLPALIAMGDIKNPWLLKCSSRDCNHELKVGRLGRLKSKPFTCSIKFLSF